MRLGGYVVPLDFDGSKVTGFLLVPYMGACIHVPPPPPNQIVYVHTKEPIEIDEIFEAVYATGTFEADLMSTELAIGAVAVAKHFGRVRAVDHVTFAVPSGEIYGFLGPNGAGKTTTIRMLLGLVRPSGGVLEVLGQDVVRTPRPWLRPSARLECGTSSRAAALRWP